MKKKIVVLLMILFNLVMVLFIPLVPVNFIGGMMSNGNVYTRKEYFTIFGCIVEKMQLQLADAFYKINWTVFIICVFLLIVVNILFIFFLKKISRKY